MDDKWKVINDEYDTLNFSAMRHNGKAYPRKYDNFDYYSSMSFTDDEHMCDSVIS